MKLYDTLSKNKKEIAKTEPALRLFVCGPTVYDHPHIGHARTYVVFDMFVKYMRKVGYKVDYLQNITDIDDKIIARAAEENIEPAQLARRFEKEYMDDMDSLGVDSVTKYARATDYIPDIIEQIQLLVGKDFAYTIEGDGIYYDISKFSDYGKLSGRSAQQAEDAVTRIDESDKKRNRGDFALWKLSKKNEPSWDSPWGEGRPGWHIEDTAITHKEFNGPQYELHGGARDLIFPHHEAEISQMEAAYNIKPMAAHWMHTGFLQVRGVKMSKSLKNFITIREILKIYPPEVLRLFFTTKLYRTPIDYDEKSLVEARAMQDRLKEFWKRLNSVKNKSEQNKKYQEYVVSFWEALEDDFNTPHAFAQLFQLITYANTDMDKGTLDKGDGADIISFLKEMNSIFNIINEDNLENSEVPKEVLDLVKKREDLRENKKWDEADKVRDELLKLGYELKDTSEGSRATKL